MRAFYFEYETALFQVQQYLLRPHYLNPPYEGYSIIFQIQQYLLHSHNTNLR